jgi:hypothetical protein
MANWNRREFIQASLASYFLHAANMESAPRADATVTKTGGIVQARGKDYTWEWVEATDQFRLLDNQGLVIASGTLQPAVVVQATGQAGARRCAAGKSAGYDVRGNAVTVHYEGVNGSAKISIAWRFEDDGFWLEPVVYDSAAREDLASLAYFAEGVGERAAPSLSADYFVIPGISEGNQISPIIPSDASHTQTCWLGHAGLSPDAPIAQQWGMPVHYFCGFHHSPYDFQKKPHVDLKEGPLSNVLGSFCCGLAEVPNGDLLAALAGGRFSPIVDYRSDLWGHLRGPGRFSLGARWYWTVGPNYYEATRRYYQGLLRAGVIRKKVNSPHKNEVALAPSFCTFGEQVAREKMNEQLDQAVLESIYDEVKRSGMKVKLFIIDGYWEGKYGSLEHSEERLPHFEETLNRIRSEGHYVGLWTATLRCADPADWGLTTDHVLRQPDGKPFMVAAGGSTILPFYILDCSQPEVQRVLTQRVRNFMRRYKPDFVKFDFGYEIPSLAVAAPKDRSWGGEQFLAKGLELFVGAMRKENPDLAVLYYSLSPLLLDYIDLHSPDDLWIGSGEFDLEANRRYFFSSLLGEIGMPTWGSSGYDWRTAPENWFDSAALGTVGNLISFWGPQADLLAKPERIAKFNGLSQVLRTSNTFSITPIDEEYYGPERGAHSSSWARSENGEVVLVALRERRLDGRKASGKFRDLVTSNTSVVIASKTGDGLTRATKLAVVPFGEGEITLQRPLDETAHAEATEHYFGGGSKAIQLSQQKGRLQVSLRERAEDGSVVEWIEVNVRT